MKTFPLLIRYVLYCTYTIVKYAFLKAGIDIKLELFGNDMQKDSTRPTFRSDSLFFMIAKIISFVYNVLLNARTF